MNKDTQTAKEKQEEKDVRAVVWERAMTLITAALSLVAALAWNDAIQSLFKTLFGNSSSLYAKFFYALVTTVVSVLLIARLANVSQSVEKRWFHKKED